MQLKINFGQKNYRVDTTKGIDISTPLVAEDGITAFYLPSPVYEPFRAGGFVGSTKEGGSCNCEEIKLSPHGSGTHTECVGHISLEKITIRETLNEHFFMAKLVTLLPKMLSNGDQCILLSQLSDMLNDLHGCEALIIRTTPNDETKLHKNYSGSNPCYLEPSLCSWLAELNVNHLIIDLPSVDREEDGGLLSAHHAFWRYPDAPRFNATITELAFIPNVVPDGTYLLNLMIASFDSDASPSKPVLYIIEEDKE